MTEVERQQAGLLVVPVLEQATGHAGDARKACLAPFIDAWADAIDEIKGLYPPGVGTGVDDLITSWSPALHHLEHTAKAVLTPMLLRRLVRRIDDQ